MRNTFILGGGLASALLLASCAGGEKQPQKKPLNIIHIMTDDHSYQTISAYGHALGKLAPTPNLDRLAAEGMLFRKAFVENSLSTPSRACLMTGLYSHQNGQRQLGAGIDTTKTFFSEILRQHGYQTGVVGKWHMRCEPKGFDFYHVFDDQGEYYNPRFKSPETNGEYVREEGYATTLTTDHAIEFLDQRDPDKPFCLLVHHKAPHRNWMPDTKYANLYEDVEFPMPETFYDDYSTRCDAARTQEMRIDDDMTMVYDLKVDELKTTDAYKNERELGGWNASIDRMTPEQREAWMAAYKPNNEKMLAQGLKGDDLVRWKYQRYIKDYVRCIKSIDDEVGRLIAYLEKEGLMDNTVIVYTSDQGFYMGVSMAGSTSASCTRSRSARRSSSAIRPRSSRAAPATRWCRTSTTPRPISTWRASRSRTTWWVPRSSPSSTARHRPTGVSISTTIITTTRPITRCAGTTACATSAIS